LAGLAGLAEATPAVQAGAGCLAACLPRWLGRPGWPTRGAAMGGNHSRLCCSPNDTSEASEEASRFVSAVQVPVVTDARLVYLDRNSKEEGSEFTVDTKSSRTSRAGKQCAAMSIIRAANLDVLAIPPEHLDKASIDGFRQKLQNHGINTALWGVDGTKSVEHLYWEVYEQRGSFLLGLDTPGTLKRVTRLVKVRVTAEIFGVIHTLFSRMQFLHNRQAVERKQVPLRRLKWTNALDDEPSQAQHELEKCRYTEDWRWSCTRCLEERLGLPERWQLAYLVEDRNAYQYKIEDNVVSDGYPGLNTLYCIHEVTFRVKHPEHPDVGCLGLPVGQEFATTEGDFNVSKQQDQEFGLPIGTQLNIWAWMRDENAQRPDPEKGKKEQAAKPAASPKEIEAELRLVRRAPLPASSAQEVVGMHARLASKAVRPPSSMLWAALDGAQTDWNVAKKIVARIQDPAYSLREYFDDLRAFPELNLYLLEDNEAAALSSGRSIGDEYQRTLGAFFAIYWLMRLHIDGKDGFAFGVDDEWKPQSAASNDESRLFPKEKRVAFQKNGRWDYFRRLLLDAGLVKQTADGKTQVVEDRLVALLALTAIHDIMKMGLLLPEVQADHAPYKGYQSGDKIADHDHALGYVMDHFPSALPSFRDLGQVEKRAVQFTQCNLCFNHGWFVQAEAPPGAVFTKFREALIVDHKSSISQPDVALYFVHWLTDLAGAEPTPLGGCGKFVVKFPLPVLNSFLRSFEFVEKIATNSETEVMEEYLKMRWTEHTPSPGPLPQGDSAVAKMRLLCMAQMNAAPVLKGFEELYEEDRQMLSVEMGRTGCMTQSYSADVVPAEVRASPVGPAFLIYYGPAFLQSLGNDLGVKRLALLAEVYRCARLLWPAATNKTGTTVIVRIDMIKALSSTEIQQVMKDGDMWLMVKHNDSEAFIERSSKKKLNKMIMSSQPVQILDLTCLHRYS